MNKSAIVGLSLVMSCWLVAAGGAVTGQTTKSQTAMGQTASLADWGGAQWVWDQPGADHSEQSNDPRFLRATFDLPAAATQAELWVTADNRCKAFVNGIKVAEGNEWKAVQKIAVAAHLVRGKNVLAVEAQNQGASAGMIARLLIQTADNKELRIVTGDHSKITQPAPANWTQIDCDDSKWPAASPLGDAQMAPWHLASGAPAAGDRNVANDGNVSDVDPKVTERLSAAAQQSYFKFPEGFELELVAADPLVINPIAIALDEQGRIYVSESHTYRYGPKGSPVEPFANPVVRLEPTANGKTWKRTLVADGFDDPVMGIAIRDGKLWLTADNYLYQYDLADDGRAINRKTLVEDKKKAWNPFGMFVLEWGPDGLLYMSVGNHEIDLHGPDGQLNARGTSGVVMRMNPDGSKMERLMQGMRVPYSFEFDPYGQLWVLSNGEGNPNRFIRVIDGVDYHCFTRPVDNNWLAGKSPLAPPCFELPRGAHTQLMRYYGGAFPVDYQGALLLDNWGAHGFSGPNRAIFSYIPDDRGNIISKESLLSCRDPHFRPSHIALDRDGNLLVADWYGRDDESDMTGRIWRLKYTGKDRPPLSHPLVSVDWANNSFTLSALNSPQQVVREKATQVLLARGNMAVQALASYAAGEYDDTAKQPLGAAHALWTLVRIGTPEALGAITSGARHPDAKVRRLAVNLLRRYRISSVSDIAAQLRSDPDPAVRVAAALSMAKPGDTRAVLLAALEHGAAADPHLRYEAASNLARYAAAGDFETLLASDEPDLRLAGLVAIDFACWEKLPSLPAAVAALNKALATPGKVPHETLLELAQFNWDDAFAPTLAALAGREDLPLAITARSYLVLRQKAGAVAQPLTASAGKRLLTAVKGGTVPMATPQDQIIMLDLLESEEPSLYAVQQVARLINSRDQNVRAAAHKLARKFGVQAASLSGSLWPALLDPKTKYEDACEQLATLARIEPRPKVTNWVKLLAHPNRLLRCDAVRSLRAGKEYPETVELLIRCAPDLIGRDADIKDDLAVVLRELNAPAESIRSLQLPDPQTDKAALAGETRATVSTWSGPDRQQHALLGRQVFERSNCVKCHTTATQTTLLAPSLKGIAAQKIEYLVESVLLPSQVIKTGFETETLVTKDGKSFSGLVKAEGDEFRVLNLDRDVRIPKADVEERSVQRISIMPEGQEKQLSRGELADVVAFLMTLR